MEYAGEEMGMSAQSVYRFVKTSIKIGRITGIRLIFLLALIIGCGPADRCEIGHKLIGYEIIESIDIPLEGVQYNHVTPNIWENDSMLLLFGLDPYGNTIDVFNLNKRKWIHTIRLENEGPNEVVSPKSIYIESPDSIFVMNDINQLYLLNYYGQKIKQWEFEFNLPESLLQMNENLTGEYIIAAYGKSDYLNLPFVYQPQTNNIIARILILNSLKGSEEYSLLYQTPNMVMINLEDSPALKLLMGKYPDNYLAEEKPHNPFAHFVTFEGGTWVQFDASDKIYWCEKDTFFCAPSLFATGNITKFGKDTPFSEEKEMRAYHTDEAYLGLYHDPDKNLLYRVFQHGQPDQDAEGKFLQKLQAPFSIMVLTPTGDVLGEVRLGEGKYNFLDFFVTSRGILISKENPFNKDNLEEFYSFDLLQLKF